MGQSISATGASLKWVENGPQFIPDINHTIDLHLMVVMLLPAHVARSHPHLFEVGDDKFLITTGLGLKVNQYLANCDTNWQQTEVRLLLQQRVLEKLAQVRRGRDEVLVLTCAASPDGEMRVEDIYVGRKRLMGEEKKEVVRRTHMELADEQFMGYM